MMAGALLLQRPAVSATDTTTIFIAATTDVHGRAMDWDYERNRPAPMGLVRAATVVDSLRRAHPGRVILVDAGDLIQGNSFGTWFARHPAAVHPMVLALNAMQYDAAAPGNHEFNFGFDTMRRALAGARYAVVSSNILGLPARRPLFRPMTIVTRAGVRVGITGATTPGVLVWDGPNVRGHATLTAIADAVPPVVRSMRAAGADVTVLVAHSGLGGTSSYTDSTIPPENDIARTIAATDLDVAVIGHTHGQIADSTVGRTLVVQAKNWAQSVAVVELSMVREAGRWRIAAKRGVTIPLRDVRPDSALVARLARAHAAVTQWVTRPLGQSRDAMPLTRARIEDTPVIDFVNEVMRRRSGADLSATAAFDINGGFPAGNVTLADLTTIYPYENTLRAIRITGAQLRAFLEQSSRYWRRMGPAGPVPDESVPGYNFDIVSGVDYELDLSRPVGERVAQLAIRGRDVRDTDSFTLALNNYRQQGGGGFAMLANAPVVYDRDEYIRDLLADEVRAKGTIAAADYFVPSWRIRGVTAATQPDNRGERSTTAVAAPATAPRNDSILLRVLSTNDVHGAMESRVQNWSNGRAVGGMATMAGMMNRLAAECACAVIRVDGGDIMQGQPASNLLFGRSMVDVFNAMHYDAAAIGNHEFDWGIDTLAARMRQASFTWVAANIRDVPSRRRPAWARPWTMVQAGPRKVAVVGYTTPGTTTSTNPVNVQHLGFLGAASLDSAIADARRAQADFVIVVAHEGAFCRDGTCQSEIVTLAEALREKPDLIVSGHTHSLVNTVVNGIPIIQARTGGTALGISDFLAAGRGRPPHMTVETVWADREQPDTAVARVVNASLAAVREKTTRVVVELADDFPRSGNQYPLADMVADALRETAHADVAIINNTGVRTGLPAGPRTWGDLYEVLPFGNHVVSMRVTGATLKQALEHAFRSDETRASVSGMRVRLAEGAPAGQRVQDITLADGRTVDPQQTYTLATFDFLASGGSGYDMLRGRPLTNTGVDELDSFIAFLQRQPQPVRAPRPHVPRVFSGY